MQHMVFVVRRSSFPYSKSTLVMVVEHRQKGIIYSELPRLPDVSGTDPSRTVLDSLKVAIGKRVADACRL